MAERKSQRSTQVSSLIKTGATASDYIETINMVKAEVKKKFDVELELEVKIVGEE